MLMAINHLQTATPIAPTGINRNILEEYDDLAYYYVRMRGLKIAIVTAYFRHTIKITGTNIALVARLSQITNSGRVPIVIMADFNMEPSVLTDTGIPDLLKCKILHTGEPTCNTTGGGKQLDYLLCSVTIAPLIHNLRNANDVPWTALRNIIRNQMLPE